MHIRNGWIYMETVPLKMKTSQQGIDALKLSEGLKLIAYQDGGGVWTIGYGHTGVDVRKATVWTLEKAEETLKKDLIRFEDTITQQVPFGLAQHQFDALVNLIYNIGITAFIKSTLLKKLKGLDIYGAADEFLRWKYDNGKEVPALANRRKRERDMFLLGAYVTK